MDRKSTKLITIGIPCYQNVSYETLEDYMRFMFHLGRRCPEYDFRLAIKGKSEQFRARNAIVEAALSHDSDYLLMLDDDHVIDIQKSLGPNESYDFLKKLIDQMEKDETIGIMGALYYQRGGNCYPVIMEKKGMSYFFKTHKEITGAPQKVDVTGGGCMLIRKEVFDKIDSPWFAPEFEYGTDVQICQKVTNAGFSVWCDTSIELGHVKIDREIISSKTLKRNLERHNEYLSRDDVKEAPKIRKPHNEHYKEDILEYTRFPDSKLREMALEYQEQNEGKFNLKEIKEYYKNLGLYQIARNYFFHTHHVTAENDRLLLGMFSNNGVKSYGLDYGCGTAPIGFEMALRGNRVDFVDIEGSEADKFIRWRCDKHNVDAGFKVEGPYDWIMLLDVLEHIPKDEAEQFLIDRIGNLKDNGSIVTNFMLNYDDYNYEHINMDKDEFKRILIENGVYPMNNLLWTKSVV
jgi:GT2 family glycosyltransferase